MAAPLRVFAFIRVHLRFTPFPFHLPGGVAGGLAGALLAFSRSCCSRRSCSSRDRRFGSAGVAATGTGVGGGGGASFFGGSGTSIRNLPVPMLCTTGSPFSVTTTRQNRLA